MSASMQVLFQRRSFAGEGDEYFIDLLGIEAGVDEGERVLLYPLFALRFVEEERMEERRKLEGKLMLCGVRCKGYLELIEVLNSQLGLEEVSRNLYKELGIQP